MAGMGITIIDSIRLPNASGEEFKIHLCRGDITKLPVEEKVTFLVVSCFPGDYQLLPGTVIGALYNNLEINLEKLSSQKEIVCRDNNLLCWLTPLLCGSPFERILCFERALDSSMPMTDLIRNLFLHMAQVLQNRNSSVITPLLATGHQGNSESQVLKVMVDSAVQAILNGMSVTSLKIVTYKPNDTLKELFADLKMAWLLKCPRKESIPIKSCKEEKHEEMEEMRADSVCL